MNLLIALFLIIFEAVPDGLADRGKKALAGVLESVYLIVITLVIFALFNGIILSKLALSLCDGYVIWRVLVGYALLRFAIFDLIYNLVRGNLPLSYIGTTKLFDRALNKIISKLKISMGLVIFARAIAFLWGFFWLMGWENGIRI